MKRKLLFGMFVLLAGALVTVQADPKDEATAAAKKLGEQANYSWKSEFDSGNFSGSTEGKTEREGLTSLSMSFGDNTTEAVLQGSKGAVKLPDQEWQSLSELASSTEQGRGRFMVRRLQTFKGPAAELQDLVSKTKDLAKDGDTYSGDLTEAGAKDLLTFRRRGNSNGPANAKGSLKIWTKDGMVSKYQVKLQGTVNFNGEDRDIDRTTTTEIKEVGTTKVTVPDAAKSKLS